MVEMPVELMIHKTRGQKGILDGDLARISEVEIKGLNEQIKRNADRFPDDFMFQVTHPMYLSGHARMPRLLGRGWRASVLTPLPWRVYRLGG
jgi:hypothetical protein